MIYQPSGLECSRTNDLGRVGKGNDGEGRALEYGSTMHLMPHVSNSDCKFLKSRALASLFATLL
jgi:hypothetical protein